MAKIKVNRNDRPAALVGRTVELLDVDGVVIWEGGRGTPATMSCAADQLLIVLPEAERIRVDRHRGATWEWALPPAQRANLTSD